MATPTIGGRYEIVREIGRGGKGSVYEARDFRLERRVALKTIRLSTAEDPGNVLEAFKREARVTGALKHPNIVDVYDVGVDEGLAYMAMEYLSGKTLGHHLNESPTSSWPTFLPVLMPCAEAFDYAHARGVVHLDVKPDNIMLTDDGPKILDFGMARLSYTDRTTAGNVIAGTAAYLAPESIRGNAAGPATDQFSLAVIVYRLLTGAFPFDGQGVTAIYRTISEVQVPVSSLNAGVPPSISAAIDRALSKDPALRFPSCVEFLNEVLPLRPGNALGEVLGRVRDQVAASSPVQLESASWTRMAIPPPGSAPRKTGWILGVLKGIFLKSDKAQPPETLAPTVEVQNKGSEGTFVYRMPEQRRISPRELERRQAEELIEFGQRGRFQDVVALQGKWLPGVDGADPLLLGFREAARYLEAAQHATSFSAVEHLRRVQRVLRAVESQLRASRTELASALTPVWNVWSKIAAAQLAEATERAASQLPNPFRAGQPLRPDQGRSLFRGREDVVRQIASILMEEHQSGSIALLGPRRCGKTSLLQMLPTLIPDSLCVFFDLQDNPVESPRAFFEALYRQAREQARKDRRLDIPGLKAGTFSGAMEWLQALDAMPHDLRILFCLDEFERLEDLFPGDHQDVLRLMGLFRATIQHRTKVRLMVSGVAPFDELGPMWNDHFINVRQVRVGHLDRDTGMDLLQRPIPDFPEGVIGRDVAAVMYSRTGGQPYLLQLYGSLLVERLNLEGRRHALAEDLVLVEQEAQSQGTHYLRHCYESAPPAARSVLEQLAVGKKPDFELATRRWLTRRGLVDHQGDLAIPLLGSFMREELGLG